MGQEDNYQKVCTFKNLELGYSDCAYWAVRKAHILVKLTDSARATTLSWLPLLEEDYSSFKQALEEGLRNITQCAGIVDFPVNDLLHIALGSHDDHWVQRGLAWVQAAQLSRNFKQQLTELMTDKRVSQPTRHAAKKLLFTPVA